MSKKSETTSTAQVDSNPLAWTPEQAAAYITSCGSVSSAIRKLTAEGKTRGQVAKLLYKRYQHVRNVLITPVKKQG